MSLCGCWYVVHGAHMFGVERRYLPQVDLSSQTTILATTSRTILTQKFINSADKALDEVQYTFPLYDGVSVVGFKCTVASRTIVGVVKEKQQARAEYKAAIDRGETAGLLEQLPEAADVFTTRIGNVPARETIVVEIVYLGELKHDAETDGVRFTIPTVIAPRYGQVASDTSNLPKSSNLASDRGGIRILVDVAVDEGSAIRGLQSPSHPIAVSMGRTSSTPEDDFDSFSNHLASATLTLGSTELEKDFIIVVLAKDQDIPRAMLEQHPSIRGQRALMATLVPRFNLPSIYPEIVFIVDRSGSMAGKIPILIDALKIFLKSLPVGVKFNICSFGSNYSFLWPKSKSYDQSSLQTALDHLATFSANYGGTEMLKPVEATVKNRYKDMPLEVMVITDGEIWNQQSLFDFINKAATKNARFFSLGIGSGASSSLVEGIARAGDGFAQFVGENEKMDKRVVRMLKGALTPHIRDYSLEVKYEKEDDEYEMVESVTDCLRNLVTSSPESKGSYLKKKAISLFDKSAAGEDNVSTSGRGRYDHLPLIATPKLLQAPHKIPSLYPFNRTTAYLLMSPETCQRTPRAIILRATSEHGPLELEMPVQDAGVGETLHQLAAKKAIHELEEGRGWITEAKNNGKLIKEQHEGRWDEMVEREAVRLGVQFQVGGKWCSFVAVEANSNTGQSQETIVEQERKSVSSESISGSTLFGGLASRSKFSGPSQPAFNAFPKPAVSGGLFGSAGASHGSGLFAQTNVSPHVPGSDGVSCSFGAPASSFGTPYQTHAVALGGAPVSSHNAGGLFGGVSRPTSEGLFGDNSGSTLKSNADVDSAAGSSGAMTGSVPQAAGLFCQPARQQSLFGYGMLAGSSPPPPPGAAFNAPLALPASPSFKHKLALQKSVTQQARLQMVQQQQMQQQHPTRQGRDARQIHAAWKSAAPTTLRRERKAGESEVRKKRGRVPNTMDHSDAMDSSDGEIRFCDVDSAAVEARAPAKARTMEDRMHELIALQEFDGSWKWESQLVTVLGMDEAKLKSICKLAGVLDDGKIQATIAAVAFLQTKARAEEEVWEMIVEKAMGWLNGKVDAGQLKKVKEVMS